MQVRSCLVGATTYRRVICPDDRIPTDEPIDGQRALVHELSFARQTLETWRLDYNAVARRRRGPHRGARAGGGRVWDVHLATHPSASCPSGYPPICNLLNRVCNPRVRLVFLNPPKSSRALTSICGTGNALYHNQLE